MKKQLNQILIVLILASALFILASSCSFGAGGGTTTGNGLTNPPAEDISATGSVVAAIGGVLSGTSANGSAVLSQAEVTAQAPICPTFASPMGSGCQASGSSMWLINNACSYSASSNSTIGGILLLQMTAGTASCGTFPNPGNSASLYRQYVSGSRGQTPGGLVYTSSFGTKIGVDNSSANLSNFDNQNITAILNGGYGSRMDYNSVGSRSALTIASRATSAYFDHTVVGSLNISESGGATMRSVSGSVSVYHNILKIVGTTTFFNVVHSDTCCLPVSGTITTIFGSGSNVAPTATGLTYVGKSESLSITGCGTGTLTKYDGTSSAVTLSRCY